MNELDMFYDEVVFQIMDRGIDNKRDLHKVKLELCRKHRLGHVPSDLDILIHTPENTRERLRRLLRIKRTRSASGVTVVSVMTEPHPCPHGRCIYCPGGPDSGTPQSYTGREPAARRAAQYHYDPYGQTRARLDQLRVMGHSTDKIELIIIGGTFTSFNRRYREDFVKSCLDAMNGCSSNSLGEAQHVNESGSSRCVGLTIETRPDCFGIGEVLHSLDLGVTRVEFGVQSIDDKVSRTVGRGHTSEHTRKATRDAKDAGLKVCYHMMPGLPGSDAENDLRSFSEIFENPDFRPDMIKIYPTVVVADTPLYELWRKGAYAPLTTEDAVKLIVKVKQIVPPWIRIQRIQREIDAHYIQAGLDKGHLRNLANNILAHKGLSCGCIRCREIGLKKINLAPEDVKLREINYEASGGLETFLSFESIDARILVAYLRMRHCDNGLFLRELKVFGEVVPLHEPPDDRWQHRGFGQTLIDEYERIAVEKFDARISKIMSGVGVRNYYKRFGYTRSGPYMVKTF